MFILFLGQNTKIEFLNISRFYKKSAINFIKIKNLLLNAIYNNRNVIGGN